MHVYRILVVDEGRTFFFFFFSLEQIVIKFLILLESSLIKRREIKYLSRCSIGCIRDKKNTKKDTKTGNRVFFTAEQLWTSKSTFLKS